MKENIRKYKILFGGVIILIIYLILVLLLIKPQDLSASQSQPTWTIFTLKEHYDYVIKELEAKIDQRFNSLELAVSVAKVEMEKRLDNTNEWRGSQDDLINTMKDTYTPKSEFNALKEQVDRGDKKQDAEDSMNQGGSKTFYIIGMAISLLITFLALGKNFIASITQKPKQ